ncbi:hypothetical protein QVD17_07774 [Tagetes erecta]|uniref:F-box domain-containing protein n=1 Tax=Tagetes erecta TaxID=13708 RepID=A0AAD8KY53_TARER|nr:hypothetical protein QVD17_07774 [Tagetes erecta]
MTMYTLFLRVQRPSFSNMDTLDEQQQSSNDQFPEEIIEQILTRLPVESILRFKSVSKPWLSLISNPSFTNLQLTQATLAHRSSLFISIYDTLTRKLYFLSAAHEGGHVTHLFKPFDQIMITCEETTELEHLNGLVLFSSGNGYNKHMSFAYVINPSTRKIYKLPHPPSELVRSSYSYYLFGFDESRNEHKILHIKMFRSILSNKPYKHAKVEVMIFSMSNVSWRKINVDLPCDMVIDWNIGSKHSVCVNSVIHLVLQNRNEILSFDLRTEKFLLINLPVECVAYTVYERYHDKGLNTIISSKPFLMKINGFLGFICHKTRNEIDVWILKDYENRVWVREKVSFKKSWFVLDGPFMLNRFIRNDKRVPTNTINVPMYDVERRRIKSANFALGYQFPYPKTLRFDHVKSYTESVLPIPKN